MAQERQTFTKHCNENRLKYFIIVCMCDIANTEHYVKQLRRPVMLPCCAPSNFSACVMKSISPTSSTTGSVQHTGRAKLILMA